MGTTNVPNIFQVPREASDEEYGFLKFLIMDVDGNTSAFIKEFPLYVSVIYTLNI